MKGFSYHGHDPHEVDYDALEQVPDLFIKDMEELGKHLDLERRFKEGQIAAYQNVLEHWKVKALVNDDIRGLVIWCEIQAKKLREEK